MLSDSLKKEIRSNYELITQSLVQFKTRKAQNYLIAEIAKVLAGEYEKNRRILVAEAGTGIGKSLAYILAGLPVALRHNKKLIISTATVTLQEQLVSKDLPFFIRHSDYKFTFTLAKGRQRYCCEQKLLSYQDNAQKDFLFTEKPQAGDIDLLNRLKKAYLEGKWDGDQDAWPTPIPHRVWQQIVSDKHSCKKSLANHRQCPFHRSRDNINKCDVIVVNHALLLADLELGGGIILPEPDSCYYVIDEAHHLPKIARDFSSANANIKTSQEWLKKIKQVSTNINRVVHRQTTITPNLNMLESANEMVNDLKSLELYLRHADINYNKSNQFRFSMGELPFEMVNALISLKEQSKKCLSAINKLVNITSEELKDGNIKQSEAEPIMVETGFYIQRLENINALSSMLVAERSDKHAPIAAWINNESEAFTLCASPLEVGGLLEYMLWSKSAGCILCSATLTSLNSFEYFMRQAGLVQNDGTQYLRLKSPFDYPSVPLTIAKMQYEPTQEGFDKELIAKISALIEDKQANLVLFASYWQMNLVADKLKQRHPTALLVQGEMSRSKLISQHKKACDRGQTSILFGTGSLAEGLDLPGHYLTNLIITKLPFAVPDSPVEEAHSEWITHRGGNPFMQITIPEASKKLIQSCGRLIRKETDTGKITMLDKRVITKRYGKSLLDALPPFSIKVEN